MTDALTILVLGIIEGVTEFLPVSSTGHLLIAQHWLAPQPAVFNVGIQSGAVLAVLAVFAGRVRDLVGHAAEPVSRDYLLKLGGAFGLTAAGGLALKAAGLELPGTVTPVAWATLVGGVLFLVLERFLEGRPVSNAVTWPMALAFGAAQLLAAAFPGASRSGATILAGLALGLSRPAAVEFSFLLGVPTLLAAAALELFQAIKSPPPGGLDWGWLALGTAVSALTAFGVVQWLLRYIQTHTFAVFGWYRVGLGLVLLLFCR